LREEVGLAVGASGEERVQRAEVRVGRGVDVRDVDLVLAVADDAELAGARAGEDADRLGPRSGAGGARRP
jgi:hypothetical protein